MAKFKVISGWLVFLVGIFLVFEVFTYANTHPHDSIFYKISCAYDNTFYDENIEWASNGPPGHYIFYGGKIKDRVINRSALFLFLGCFFILILFTWWGLKLKNEGLKLKEQNK